MSLIIRLAAFCLAVISTCAFAQTPSATAVAALPDAPASAPSANVPPSQRTLFRPIADRRSSENHTVWSKEFTAWIVAANVATVLDFESTIHAMKKYPGVEETSVLYGTHPTRLRLYGVGVPMNAGLEFLSYYVKRKYCPSEDCWAWRIPTISLTLAHTGGAAANLARYY